MAHGFSIIILLLTLDDFPPAILIPPPETSSKATQLRTSYKAPLYKESATVSRLVLGVSNEKVHTLSERRGPFASLTPPTLMSRPCSRCSLAQENPCLLNNPTGIPSKKCHLSKNPLVMVSVSAMGA